MSEANTEFNEPETDARPEANANAEAARHRKKAAELKAQLEAVQAKFADLEIELDDTRKKLESAPGDAAAKIADLESKLRGRVHRDAFNRLAAEKIRPDALDDAFALSGWKVESDDIDENTMGEVIGSLIESKPYLKAEEAKSPVEASTSPAAARSYSLTGNLPKPLPGAGRGPAPESNTKNTKSAYRL